MDLEAENRLLRALLAQRDATIVELRARVEAAEEGAARLERELERLRRQVVGPTSERVVDPDRTPLAMPPGDDDETAASPGEPSASAPAPEVVREGATPEEHRAEKAKDRRRKDGSPKQRPVRRNVKEMDHLRTLTHEARVENRRCPCGCGAPAETIGFDESWRIERVPAEYVRHRVLVEKVAFPGHIGPGKPTIATALSPVSYALPKALPGNRLLAQVVIDKYADHLPLHRQAERFQREGFDLSRSTLCDWMMELADLIRPIPRYLALEVRGGSMIRADATGMPVMDSALTKGKAHYGHMMAYGNYDTVIFGYTPDKKAPTVKAMFEGFKGVLLIDGASDFNLLEATEGITRAGCWAHARRKLYEALSFDKHLALAGLAAVRQLFLAERVVMAAPIADRIALRRELCEPLLRGIREWVDSELPKQTPRTPSHGALQYLDNQWDRLVVFLEHAEIACDNNATERDLRRPVKGKANFMFAGSPRGAAAMADYYTLVGTCLLQGMDPRRYLDEILGRLDEPPIRLTPQAVRESWANATKLPKQAAP